MARREIEGLGFRHALFERPDRPKAGVLRLYLEGDGRPLIDRRLPRADPTPERPVALELMALDPGPAILLGRPCHHGLVGSGCPEAGAGLRFSEAAVASLAAAASRLARGHDGVLLVGYSGGAALALALACRLERVRAVVTVAGVLDPGAWARHHGLPPLDAGSPPVCARELHLVGGSDRIAPPTLLDRPGEVWRFEAYEHGCCWREAWPAALVWMGG